MLDRDQATKLIVNYLRKAAKAHMAGDFNAIEEGYEDMDFRMPRNAGPQWDNLLVALEFWGGWIDANNNDWLYYEPIAPEDWPVLAGTISDEIESGKDISDQTVLGKFFFRNSF